MSECPNDCAALRQALDEAGETIAALADEADLQASVAAALVDCLRQEHQRAEGLLLERDVAQQEVTQAYLDGRLDAAEQIARRIGGASSRPVGTWIDGPLTTEEARP